MMQHRRIGAADVWNITEIIGPTHDPAMLYPDLPAEERAEVTARLPAAHYCADIDRLVIGIQIWICRVGDEMVVIDTGVGNRKPRGLPRFDQLNTLVPAWFDAIGAGRDQVTTVINTHLHGDHVGWNTTGGETGWEPWFRNATYLMPQADYDYWKPRAEAAGGIGETECFPDSIDPLVAAGRVRFYSEGEEIVPHLTAHSARGHTPGQMRIDLESDGERATFCADIFHSPLQILRPDVNTAIDVEPEHARATRAAFLDEMADTGALFMPCHFGWPHCGRVRRNGTGYVFVPEQR